jgi:4-amino-4-deoxy-L-arabinose transferase-like glycosyltransferase
VSSRRVLLCLGAILVIALGLRLGRWAEERRGILAQVPTGDERTYDQWAQRIAQGEQPPMVPYQAPLPAWVLAAWHRALEPGPARDAHRLFGVLLGVATCGLTFLLGRRLGGAAVGLVAAALVALHPASIYYEPTLLRDGPSAFLVAFSAWLLLRGLDTPTGRWGLGAGLMLGGGALWRENLLLVGGLVGVCLVRWAWRQPSRRGYAAAFALGLAMPLAPVWVQNHRLEGGFSPFPTWNGGCVFYVANQRSNHGVGFLKPPFVAFDNPEGQVAGFTREAERRLGRSLTPHRISSFWLRQGLVEILADPGLYVVKVGRRMVCAAASQEFVQARDLRLDRDSSLVLRLPLPGFGILVGFALLGAWAHRRRTTGLVLAGLIVATVGATLPVGFVTRYRLPAVPLVAALAALGLSLATRRARRGQWRGLIGGLCLGLCLTSIPVGYDSAATRWSRGLAYLESGQPAPAFAEIQQIGLALRPGYWERAANLLALNGEPDLAASAVGRARESWAALAEQLRREGRAEAARVATQRARDLE